MAGMGAAFGEAAAASGGDESEIGEIVSQMLKKCREAKVEPLAKRRNEALQRKWRGENVPGEDLLPGFGKQSHWDEITRQFPALGEGPGAYHRMFAVAEITERDAWKSRKLAQVIRSKHPGSEEHGDTIRIPTSVSTSELGKLLMEHLRSW